MLVVLTETYCNKVNIQITQRDDFIQIINHKVHNQIDIKMHGTTIKISNHN